MAPIIYDRLAALLVIWTNRPTLRRQPTDSVYRPQQQGWLDRKPHRARGARNGARGRSKPINTTTTGFRICLPTGQNLSIHWPQYRENKALDILTNQPFPIQRGAFNKPAAVATHPQQPFPVQCEAFNEPAAAGTCCSCCRAVTHMSPKLGGLEPEIKSFIISVNFKAAGCHLRVGHGPHPN